MRRSLINADLFVRSTLSCKVEQAPADGALLTIVDDDDGGFEFSIHAPSAGALDAIADAIYHYRMDCDADMMQLPSPTVEGPPVTE
jgi:hypothetical protein